MRLIIILFAFLSIISNLYPQDNSNYVIVGRVFDNRNKPVSDAVVSVDGYPVQSPTDGKGKYKFKFPKKNSTGNHIRITVLKDNYAPYTQIVTLEDNMPPVDDIILINNLKPSKKKFKSGNDYLKVLLLPFERLENCTGSISNFERTLMIRINQLAELEKLKVEVLFDSSYPCPMSFKAGKEIGIKINADVVLWGEFHDYCSDSQKTCLRYVRVKEYSPGEIAGNLLKSKFYGMSSIMEGFIDKDVETLLYFTMGMSAFKDENFKLAIKYLEKVKNSESVPIHEIISALSDSYLRMSNYEQAIGIYKNAVQAMPYDPFYYQQLVYLYGVMYNYRSALSVLEQGIKAIPDHPYFYSQPEAMSIIAGGNRSLAKIACEYWEKGRELFPGHPIFNGLGPFTFFLSELKKENGNEYETLKSNVRIAANYDFYSDYHSSAVINLIQYFEKNGDADSVEFYYKYLIDNNISYDHNVEGLLNYYIDQKRFDEAESLLKSEYMKTPEEYRNTLMSLFENYYFKIGNYDIALKYLVEEQKADSSAFSGSSSKYIEAGKFDSFINVYKKTFKDYKGRKKYYDFLIEYYLYKNDIKNVYKLFSEYLRHLGKEKSTIVKYAAFLYERKEYKKAISYLLNLSDPKIVESDYDLLLLLATCYKELGDYKKAVSFYGKYFVLNAYPMKYFNASFKAGFPTELNHYKAYKDLIALYRNWGDNENASRVIRKALNYDKHCVDFWKLYIDDLILNNRFNVLEGELTRCRQIIPSAGFIFERSIEYYLEKGDLSLIDSVITDGIRNIAVECTDLLEICNRLRSKFGDEIIMKLLDGKIPLLPQFKSEIIMYQSNVLIQRSEYGLAENLLSKAYEESKDIRLRNHLIYILGLQKKYSSIKELKPQNEEDIYYNDESIETTINYLYKLGRRDSASMVLKTVLTKDEGIDEFGYWMGYSSILDPVWVDSYFVKRISGLRSSNKWNKGDKITRAYTFWANYYDRKSEYQKVINITKSAYDQDTLNIYFIEYLGYGYGHTGRLDSAEYFYKKAIVRKDAQPFDYDNLIRFYENSNKKDKAFNIMKKAISAFPAYVKYYDNIGDYYEGAANIDSALWYYTKAINISTNDSYAFYKLGLLHQVKLNYVESIMYYERSILINEDNYDECYQQLIYLCIERKNYKKANYYLAKFLNIHKDTSPYDWVKEYQSKLKAL